MHVTTSDPPCLDETITASVELLTRPGDAVRLQAPVDVTFPGIEMVDVTPFLVVRVTDARGESRATVVLAALTGDPPGRHDELLARQIDTPEKFLRLLALMLSLGGAGGMADLLGDGTGSARWNAGQLGVFETLGPRPGDRSIRAGGHRAAGRAAPAIREGPPGLAGGLCGAVGTRMGGPRPADRGGIMSRFDAEPILEPLKDFQRATVEHVTESSLSKPAAEPALPGRRRDRPRQEPGSAGRHRPGDRATAG